MIVSIWSTVAVAATHWADWPTDQSPDDPGTASADRLLDKPAGGGGVVRVQNGHFYSGDKRVRFWGVNLAFGANFPTHDEADRLARRFSRFGINSVRFHHMDNQPFPNGIFADKNLDKLSPEALDRLDYFIAALKREGVYADLNLHVSRPYNHYHVPDGAKEGPHVDKIVDLFDPELIAAQKQYATDLLTHVNGYTHNRYADEPAVGIVEINNENSLFMWGAEQTIKTLPKPYDAVLKSQWNHWLLDRYKAREALAKAWSSGEEPLSTGSMVGPFTAKSWQYEKHGDAAVSVLKSPVAGQIEPEVTHVDGTAWHLQLVHAGLKLQKGHSYLVRFVGSADRPMSIDVSVGQAHEPWENLGLTAKVKLTTTSQPIQFPFTATADDDNGRLSFVYGTEVGKLFLKDVQLLSGGRVGLGDEDSAKGTVEPFPPLAMTAGRHDDWYRFLAETEQSYYVGMKDYLKKEVGVKMPITGTIGFGPLGTMVQSKMDFVDAHAYWEHPSFPHKQWDMSDWRIENQSMTAHPKQATLWGLAATRVAGMPFTVTEYQHPSPNDFQAECIPTIAAYAASQDWDGVFIFAYSHDSKYRKGTFKSFFDIEDDAAKMPLMPIGARVFLGSAVTPAADDESIWIPPSIAIAAMPSHSTDIAGFLTHDMGVKNLDDPGRRVSVRLTEIRQNRHDPAGSPRPLGRWDGPAAAVRIRTTAGDGIDNDFSTVMVVSADPAVPIDKADRLLISAVGRVENTDMGWDAGRHTVGTHWGHAPTRIDVINGDIRLPGKWSHAYPLDAAGRPTKADVAHADGDGTLVRIGETPAILYVVER